MTFSAHIDGGHELAIRYGYRALRGPENADMGLVTEMPGPFTIYEKNHNGDRYLLRFYTTHDWEDDPKPLWYIQKNGANIAGGHYHEGLKAALEE